MSFKFCLSPIEGGRFDMRAVACETMTLKVRSTLAMFQTNASLNKRLLAKNLM